MADNKQPSSRTCFLCGRENPLSLKMHWYEDRENMEIRATVTVPEHFNGYPGVVHGGIQSAILDETAGRAIMLERNDYFMVTLKLEVTFHHPTPTGKPLTAVGRVIKSRKRSAKVEGEILLEDGTVTASCTAVIVEPPQKFLESWEQERKYWYIDPD